MTGPEEICIIIFDESCVQTLNCQVCADRKRIEFI